jgi:hypothetical protein
MRICVRNLPPPRFFLANHSPLMPRERRSRPTAPGNGVKNGPRARQNPLLGAEFYPGAIPIEALELQECKLQECKLQSVLLFMFQDGARGRPRRRVGEGCCCGSSTRRDLSGCDCSRALSVLSAAAGGSSPTMRGHAGGIICLGAIVAVAGQQYPDHPVYERSTCP